MSDTIRCRIGPVVRCGRVVSVAESVDPMAVARAARGERGHDARVAVAADAPGPAHEYVGCIHPEMGLRTRTALAAAARSRGFETPHDEALAEARERLASRDIGGTAGHESGDERTQHRRDAARATGETEALREAVAAARGRLQERREQGLDPTPAAEELAEAVARLSEVETDAVAAGQQLEAVREDIRERRDSREERFRVEDRVANLERQARAHLREQIHEEYVAALADVPGASDIEDPFAADPVTRALAVAHVAALSAPVVLACRRFETPREAADWLDAPVIRVLNPAADGATGPPSARGSGP